MGDLLDTTQIVNGLAVLLSFYVGYKYAAKKQVTEGEDAATKKDGETATGDFRLPTTEKKSFCNNYKMVLVVRNDLKMGKGKIAAQCGHGAVGAYENAVKRDRSLVRAWQNTGCAKIALKVESEREMMVIKRAAEAKNLITCLIRDAGRTQIEPNSKTVLAIGPAAASDIDEVTGHLKLL